jgi:predicted transcriptional regulator of viral defense system
MGTLQLKPEEKLAQLITSGTSLVNTVDAAIILGLKPNTLRVWASRGKGDLIPVRTKNGAKWRLTDIRNLIGA